MKLIDVLVIRGAPGVGKSTLGKLLTKEFPKGVKIEVDILRKMVNAVDWKNQQEHINLLQVAAKLTESFLSIGFRPVIVVDTFSGNKVTAYLETVRRLRPDVSIQLIGLYASPETLHRRIEARPSDEFKDFSISVKINADLQQFKIPHEHQIDTTDFSPEALVMELQSKLKYDA